MNPHRIRVLVVDDAVVVRRVLSVILSDDPEIEVVGASPNGRVALDDLERLRPDVVILDVEMPEMDGLTALSGIRARDRALPVLMFSSLTERGASATLEALARGANDYVTKPERLGGLEHAAQNIRAELIPKIKLWGGRRVLSREGGKRDSDLIPAMGTLPQPSARAVRPGRPIEVVAIGASTGGPNALTLVLSHLPPSLPVPVVVVQHMPPIFTKLLAERLDANTSLRVREGATGEVLKPGTVWIAPGNHHMAVGMKGGCVSLSIHQGEPENSCRPSVDVLFRSVADVYGAGTLAVVMTGMGQDGLRGCQRVHDAGGRILVQDEASSVVWGMPGYVAKAGLADGVFSVDRLGGEAARIVSGGRTGGRRPIAAERPAP